MYVQSGLSCRCNLYVLCWFFLFAGVMRTGLDYKLYKMQVHTSKYNKITHTHTHTHTTHTHTHTHTHFSLGPLLPFTCPCITIFKILQVLSDIIRSSNPRQVAGAAIIPEQHILVLAMTSMIHPGAL